MFTTNHTALHALHARKRLKTARHALEGATCFMLFAITYAYVGATYTLDQAHDHLCWESINPVQCEYAAK